MRRWCTRLLIQDSLYDVTDLKEISSLQLKLITYKKSIDSLLQVFSSQESETPSTLPSISTLKEENEQFNSSTIQYSVSDSSIYCFTISPDTLVLSKTVISRDSLNTLVKRYKEWVEFSDYRDLSKEKYLTKVREFNRLSHKLYNLLLKPSEPYINDRIKIIPDPMLAGISFDALCMEKNSDATSFAEMKYAIEKYCFHFKTIKTGNQTREKKNKKAFLSIMPDYKNKPDYGYLGSSGKEYNYLKEHTHADIWTQEKATPTYLKHNWQDYSVINFTGHASAPRDYFLSPYISLNEDSISLDKITADDIQYDDINADLIILNACQTQDGIKHHTEGMLGLHKAFYLADCRSIISTMWPVTDKESAEVTRTVFEEMKDGKATDRALRNAKLKILDSKNPILSAPYFWASHNLNGNPKEISEMFRSNKYIYYTIAAGIILIFGYFSWSRYKPKKA